MNRREMLIAAGIGGLLVPTVSAESTADSNNYLELKIASKAGELAFAVEETREGKSVGIIRSENEQGLSLFLRRTFQDMTAPKAMRFHVSDGATLERVWAAVKAIKAAGYLSVTVFGCLPPGCGLPAGSSPNATRHHGTVFTIDQLNQHMARVSEYC